MGVRRLLGKGGGGGSGPPNPCGTGASYPAGWKFLHTEISGGLGSWGNMLKVDGYNSFSANVENITDGSLNVCYKNGEIDFDALDAFFTVDADVEIQFDQLSSNDLLDNISGEGYYKSDNDLNAGQTAFNSTFSGALASLKNNSPRTICLVIDYPVIPPVNQFFGPLRFPSSIGADQWVWSGNNVSLIMRMSSPNQGYFYNGLRSAGTKLIIWTYDGTTVINRSGMNLYWNGNTTPETPAGIYNSGSPSEQTISSIAFGSSTSTPFYKELDVFDHAFTTSEIEAALEVYEQKYTFS